jgi:ABC-type dipeptide/oligopeptide/nickel transport system ATPase component
MNSLLKINHLKITFKTSIGSFCAVKNINLHINQGEILGLVGESGCGKSATAEAILFPKRQRIEGEIWFKGENLLVKSEKEMQFIRGKKISMIFQDPLTSLNPRISIGKQIQEMIHQHENLNRKQEVARVLELLNLVGIPDPKLRINHYPYQFSGGMRQRIMIAIAIACNPELIIADEPTTSLDVTFQAQILFLLKNLCRQGGMSMLFITHDFGVIAGTCDRVAVIKAGEIIETGTTDQIFYHPQHPYTNDLLNLAKI